MAGIDPADRGIIERAMPYTMTGVARLEALVRAVRYTHARGIPGAFVECGVWRGGSVLAIIGTLQDEAVDDRDIYLFDTFDGMTRPTEHDVSDYNPPALEEWEQARQRDLHPWAEHFGPASFTEESVRQTILATGYPEARVHFVRGRVEDTLPGQAPPVVGLLRLDTDWYESTAHELSHLYPRLSPGGVLVIDDYGHWQGCRRAVDEYFAGREPLLLQRVDYTCRVAVKQ